jgi:NAD(P)-dependent dehydrogenase (short-subunit alcohol dehydrogenase family)
MKVVVVGSTGVIGAAVVRALERAGQHEVIGVSRHTLPALDIESPVSIEEFFRGLSGIEALLCCAGSGVFKPLAQLTDDDFQRSLDSKLLGQVGLARVALRHVAANGSITLTSGILAQRPMRGSAAISLVNAGLEGFVRAAAMEAPRGIRVNVVSPPWVTETLEKLGMEVSAGLPADTVANAYVAAVEGKFQGQTLNPVQFV